MEFASHGVAETMRLLASVNHAYSIPGTVQRQKARSLANKARWERQLARTEDAIAEIAGTPDAIADSSLRAQMDLLEENKSMLVSMLKKIPEQLKILEETVVPAQINAIDQLQKEKELEHSLGQWRFLTRDPELWHLEAGKVVFHDGPMAGRPVMDFTKDWAVMNGNA